MFSKKYGCDMSSWREERMKNVPMNFWQRVYELQNRQGVQLCVMAHYADLEDEEYEELQRSGKEPDLLTAVQIANGLGVSVEYLVTGNSHDVYKEKYDRLVRKIAGIHKDSAKVQSELSEIQLEYEMSEFDVDSDALISCGGF